MPARRRKATRKREQKNYNIPCEPIITVKPKIHYSQDELYRRGWSREDVWRLLEEPDARIRTGISKKGKFFYDNMFLIERVERAEVEHPEIRERTGYLIREFFKERLAGNQIRHIAQLEDGRMFDGDNGLGFTSKRSLISRHNSVFGIMKSRKKTVDTDDFCGII